MSSGRSAQLAKAAGEYLVAAELCRMKLVATTFAGNIPDFDIISIDASWKSSPVQVKTIQTQRGAWQFEAKRYLEIEIKNGVQKVLGKVKLSNPNLPFVFVKLVGQGKDEFYVCRAKDLQNLLFRGYRNYLEKKKGVRPRNPNSTHWAFWPRDLEKFRDNWTVITKPG